MSTSSRGTGPVEAVEPTYDVTLRDGTVLTDQAPALGGVPAGG